MSISFKMSQDHDEYMNSITDLLTEKNWIELVCEIFPDQLEKALSFVPIEDPEKNSFIRVPSITQFYFDLCGLWDYATYESYADITISLIGSGMDFLDSEEHRQEYVTYALDTADDWEFFIKSLIEETALIFPGRFKRTKVAEDRYVYNTKRKNQVTLSAVCVDVDSSNRDEDGISARTPVSLESVQSLLSSIEPSLLPSYISLTGNGLHLWYLFPQMPTGSPKATSQRKRMSDLYRALTSYITQLSKDLPLVVDPGWINHGYRAPGSITKYGDPCRCFASPGDPFASRVKDPVQVYNDILSLSWFDKSSYSKITVKDIVFRPLDDLHDEDLPKPEPKKPKPSTASQKKYARDLYSKGFMDEKILLAVESSTSRVAHGLIKEVVSTIPQSQKKRKSPRNANPLPESINVDGKKRYVRAHHFKTGKEGGGVYRTILDSITKVEPGRRERALYMLAGVAYLMCDPVYPQEKVRKDFVSLLRTDWAKGGTLPLTESDVDSALKGYSMENAARIYKKSIISVLGFNPFSSGCYDDEHNPPPKRNGRTQADHLSLCRETYKEKSHESKVAALASYLKENPDASMRCASRDTGISRPTVAKYWDEAKVKADIY